MDNLLEMFNHITTHFTNIFPSSKENESRGFTTRSQTSGYAKSFCRPISLQICQVNFLTSDKAKQDWASNGLQFHMVDITSNIYHHVRNLLKRQRLHVNSNWIFDKHYFRNIGSGSNSENLFHVQCAYPPDCQKQPRHHGDKNQVNAKWTFQNQNELVKRESWYRNHS